MNLATTSSPPVSCLIRASSSRLPSMVSEHFRNRLPFIRATSLGIRPCLFLLVSKVSMGTTWA